MASDRTLVQAFTQGLSLKKLGYEVVHRPLGADVIETAAPLMETAPIAHSLMLKQRSMRWQ
jgi:hypothetical protein